MISSNRFSLLVNRKSTQRLLWLLFVVFLLVSLCTLHISPLPWYDEVDFAGITNGYINTGKFTCTVNDLYFPARGTEVLYYGPVYFVLNSIVMKFFGVGMIQFRLLNFLSGIGCVFLFNKLFARISGDKYKKTYNIVFALLMVSDYTYFQDMHSGRMDLMALFFVLLGLIAADSNAKNVMLMFFLSGLLIVTGLLTTPRVYFIVIPYYGYLLYQYVKTKQTALLAGIVCATVTTCVVYAAWVILKFGSITGFINYLNGTTSYFNTASEDFFVAYTNIPAHQAVYFILLLLLLAGVAIRDYKQLLGPVNIICIAVIVFFLVVAGGSPVNMALITGFVYMLAINLSAAFTKGKNDWMVPLLLIANFALAGYKYFIVFSNYANRNPQQLNEWMQNIVPAGSKVVAEDKYYYSVLHLGAQFQYILRGATDEQRVKYHTDDWKADYLITADTTGNLFRKYQSYAKLIFVKEYKPAEKMKDTKDYTSSYHGYLFRFVR